MGNRLDKKEGNELWVFRLRHCLIHVIRGEIFEWGKFRNATVHHWVMRPGDEDEGGSSKSESTLNKEEPGTIRSPKGEGGHTERSGSMLRHERSRGGTIQLEMGGAISEQV